jgi:hypothetical protein
MRPCVQPRRGLLSPDFRSTNKSISWQACNIVELRNGKAIRSRVYADNASMLRQLGVLAMPKAPPPGNHNRREWPQRGMPVSVARYRLCQGRSTPTCVALGWGASVEAVRSSRGGPPSAQVRVSPAGFPSRMR